MKKLCLILAVCCAVSVAAQSQNNTQTSLAHLAYSEFDCVGTSITADGAIDVACDIPSGMCSEVPDTEKVDCEHRHGPVSRENWPELWGEFAPGRLLRAKFVTGHMKAVANCSGQDMLERQMRALRVDDYPRNQINHPGPPTLCLREVSGFVEKLLAGQQ